MRLVKLPSAILVAQTDPITSFGSRRQPHRQAQVEVGPGSRLGEFEVVSHLASGGMGAVYRATDTKLGRDVALKVLPREFGEDAERLARFEQEAKVLAQLNHPNIATLYSFGQEADVRYLAMELVDGQTLSERLEDGLLPAEDTLRIAREIAAALQQAHRRGIIHRDLKPANVMLTAEGSKLLDFGLAKGLGVAGMNDATALDTATALTTQGTILGTLYYMSPEQLQARAVDVRSDIFSFGAVVYEMASGLRAFPGESQATVIGSILHADPSPIPPLQLELPRGLNKIVERCLRKDPEARWPDIDSVLEALEALEADHTAARTDVSGRVVVLPFLSADPDPEQQTLAHGIAEELTARLGTATRCPLRRRTSTQS